jgi:hypothetical protein
MKLLGKIIGGIVVLLILVLVILRITGFPPNERRAGLWLPGHVVAAPADWSFTDQYPEVQVQTNTWYGIPHSVTIYCATYNSTLYIGSLVAKGAPPFGRQWNKNVIRDAHIRLKIGDNVYDLKATSVTDQAETDAVAQNERKKYPNFKYPPDSTFNYFRLSSN